MVVTVRVRDASMDVAIARHYALRAALPIYSWSISIPSVPSKVATIGTVKLTKQAHEAR